MKTAGRVVVFTTALLAYHVCGATGWLIVVAAGIGGAMMAEPKR